MNSKNTSIASNNMKMNNIGLVQSNMMSVAGFVTHYGAAGFFNNNNKKRVNNNNPKLGGAANQAYGGGAYDHPPPIQSSNENSVMINQNAAG